MFTFVMGYIILVLFFYLFYLLFTRMDYTHVSIDDLIATSGVGELLPFTYPPQAT